MKTFHKITIGVALLFVLSTISAQENFIDYKITKDTLIAGENNVFYVNGSYYNDVSNIEIYLYEIDIIPIEECPTCYKDSIYPTLIEAYNDTIVKVTMNIPYGTYPTEYRFYYRNAEDNYMWEFDPVFIVSKPYIIETPNDQMLCYNDDVTLEVKSYSYSFDIYNWYFNGDLIQTSESGILQITNMNEAQNGVYYCLLENVYGSVQSSDINVSMYTTPEVGLPSGPTAKCKGAEDLEYTLPEEALIESYTWNISPAEAGSLTMDDNAVVVSWDDDFVGNAQISASTQLEFCPGLNSESLDVRVVGPEFIPEICIIGVDDVSGKYQVVWNEINDLSIVSYNIYRESNVAGEYLNLAQVSVSDLSVYIDQSSSPDMFSHNYALSYIDTCGNESELSSVHSTIHLAANVGTTGGNNLSWTPYLGFSFLTYDVYRGTHPDSLTLFQQVNSNLTSLSDFDPPVGMVYYQVVVSRDGLCNPAKKSTSDYSVSKSNVAEYNNVGVENRSFADMVELFPNPADDLVQIRFKSANVFALNKVAVYNIAGVLLKEIFVDEGANSFSLVDLEKGMYLIELNIDNQRYIQKLYKN